MKTKMPLDTQWKYDHHSNEYSLSIKDEKNEYDITLLYDSRAIETGGELCSLRLYDGKTGKSCLAQANVGEEAEIIGTNPEILFEKIQELSKVNGLAKKAKKGLETLTQRLQEGEYKFLRKVNPNNKIFPFFELYG